MDLATAEVVILDDHAGRREQLQRVLARGGYGHLHAVPGISEFRAHLEAKSGHATELLLVSFSPSPMAWTELAELRKLLAGPLLLLLDAEPDEQQCRKSAELGAPDFLVISDDLAEALPARIETLLMSHHLQSVIQDNDRRIQHLFVNILFVMVKILDSKDPYTRLHSHSVAIWSRMLGRRAGLSEEELERLGLAAVLHDFGKIGVPEAILNNPNRLTPDELSVIKQHPAIARDLLSSLELLADLLPAVMHHHERFDGQGYPSGLKGEHIPLWARIIALADAYDTMASKRVYKEPMTHEEVISELVKGRGAQFDPHLTDILVELLEERRRSGDAGSSSDASARFRSSAVSARVKPQEAGKPAP